MGARRAGAGVRAGAGGMKAEMSTGAGDLELCRLFSRSTRCLLQAALYGHSFDGDMRSFLCVSETPDAGYVRYGVFRSHDFDSHFCVVGRPRNRFLVDFCIQIHRSLANGLCDERQIIFNPVYLLPSSLLVHI